MKQPDKQRADHKGVVWERSAPVPRPTPVALNREDIVRVAVALADRQGLDAVSLRNVAGALDAGPMRLYGYVASKEELLQLLVDEVYGEMVAEGPIRGPWRAALRAVAQRIRRAAQAHRWFVGLLSGRTHLGPNALSFMEAALAALTRAKGFDIDSALDALRILTAYVVGAIETEAGELRAEHESGMSTAEWQRATWPYLQRMLATGRFPTLAKVISDAVHPSADQAFESGLECVLDGIDASVLNPTSRRAVRAARAKADRKRRKPTARD